MVRTEKRKRGARNVPVTQDLIDREMARAKDRGTEEAWAVFFMVLFDKHGYDRSSARALWAEVERVAAEVDDGGKAVKRMIRELPTCKGIGEKVAPYRPKGPPSKLEMNRSRRWARDLAMDIAIVLFLTALRRVENPGQEMLGRIYDEYLDLKDSLDSGRVRAKDLRGALDEESGVVLR